MYYFQNYWNPAFTPQVFNNVTVRFNGLCKSLIQWSVEHFCIDFDMFFWIIVLLKDPRSFSFSLVSLPVAGRF